MVEGVRSNYDGSLDCRDMELCARSDTGEALITTDTPKTNHSNTGACPAGCPGDELRRAKPISQLHMSSMTNPVGYIVLLNVRANPSIERPRLPILIPAEIDVQGVTAITFRCFRRRRHIQIDAHSWETLQQPETAPNRVN